ncbi:MAG: hypothetical protein ACM3JI_00560, partial [Anaerolineae bacterium]
HASGLSKEQIHVPLYYKLGVRAFSKDRLPAMTSHVDIFPTLLHVILKEEPGVDLMEGRSILSENRSSFAISARYNASRTPYEFLIHNGSHKMIARFCDEKNIFASKALRIISIKDESDREISIDQSTIEEQFGQAIEKLCTHSDE